MEASTNPVRKWRIGDITVTRILEVGPLVIPPFAMLKATVEDVKRHAWLAPEFVVENGFLKVNIQSFVIETDGRRILVDPGIGNDKPRQMVPHFNMLKTPFLKNLTDAGFAPESIDTVLCTHLHQDHVGWNTSMVDGRWVATFPNARYLFGKEELGFARQANEEDGAVFGDSIQPILDAGLADLVDGGADIAPGLELDPTPGHSGGHFSLWLTSRGETAAIAGDVLQHPLQAAMPDVCSNYCLDEVQARTSRRRFLKRVEESRATMFAAHFADPVRVRVAADGSAWQLFPAG